MSFLGIRGFFFNVDAGDFVHQRRFSLKKKNRDMFSSSWELSWGYFLFEFCNVRIYPSKGQEHARKGARNLMVEGLELKPNVDIPR